MTVTPEIEKTILEMHAEGRTNADISQKLGVGRNTVSAIIRRERNNKPVASSGAVVPDIKEKLDAVYAQLDADFSAFEQMCRDPVYGPQAASIAAKHQFLVADSSELAVATSVLRKLREHTTATLNDEDADNLMTGVATVGDYISRNAEWFLKGANRENDLKRFIDSLCSISSVVASGGYGVQDLAGGALLLADCRQYGIDRRMLVLGSMILKSCQQEGFDLIDYFRKVNVKERIAELSSLQERVEEKRAECRELDMKIAAGEARLAEIDVEAFEAGRIRTIRHIRDELVKEALNLRAEIDRLNARRAEIESGITSVVRGAIMPSLQKDYFSKTVDSEDDPFLRPLMLYCVEQSIRVLADMAVNYPDYFIHQVKCYQPALPQPD
ncbi:MAG: hypothetical protein J9259_10025 [Thermoplasmata archaeon YP2-bin.285]|uniref:Uncharacterized protein n=1 Tax=Candidatus Sysuiplasma superficiale TaxID=2823368 RepID=A0A8J7YLS0_9ARCH|nr:hypothetical protein [Candidatus Sysuiplasma superficiale]